VDLRPTDAGLRQRQTQPVGLETTGQPVWRPALLFSAISEKCRLRLRRGRGRWDGLWFHALECHSLAGKSPESDLVLSLISSPSALTTPSWVMVMPLKETFEGDLVAVNFAVGEGMASPLRSLDGAGGVVRPV